MKCLRITLFHLQCSYICMQSTIYIITLLTFPCNLPIGVREYKHSVCSHGWTNLIWIILIACMKELMKLETTKGLAFSILQLPSVVSQLTLSVNVDSSFIRSTFCPLNVDNFFARAADFSLNISTNCSNTWNSETYFA